MSRPPTQQEAESFEKNVREFTRLKKDQSRLALKARGFNKKTKPLEDDVLSYMKRTNLNHFDNMYGRVAMQRLTRKGRITLAVVRKVLRKMYEKPGSELTESLARQFVTELEQETPTQSKSVLKYQPHKKPSEGDDNNDADSFDDDDDDDNDEEASDDDDE